MKRAVIVTVSLVAAFALRAAPMAAVGAAPTATRTLVAEAPAKGAPGRLLGLSTVTVPAGVTLAKHRHPGSQLGSILTGRLTYTVFKGAVQVYRVDDMGMPSLSRTIKAGQTAVLAPGYICSQDPGRHPHGREPRQGAGADLARVAVPEGRAGRDPGRLDVRRPVRGRGRHARMLVVADAGRRAATGTCASPGALLDGDERSPRVVLDLLGSWLLLVTGGGPTPDKPGVTLDVPADPNQVSSQLIFRVDDCRTTYGFSRSRGAEFVAPPVDRGGEIQAFFRDPDGHLFEISELTSG